MDTRVCKICGRELPIDMFEFEHTKNGDIRRHQCRDCRAKYRKQRRINHPEIHRAQEIRRVKRVREWQNSLKSPCIVCGEKEPVCLDWHHLDPNQKELTIGRSFNRAREILMKEISKCVCLCSNCHRKVHAGLINLKDYVNA